eukprot:gene40046-52885_t
MGAESQYSAYQAGLNGSLPIGVAAEDMAAGKPPLGMGAGNKRLAQVHPQSHQGICGDAIASMEGISREALDALYQLKKMAT